jgi:hypothetical protein
MLITICKDSEGDIFALDIDGHEVHIQDVYHRVLVDLYPTKEGNITMILSDYTFEDKS